MKIGRLGVWVQVDCLTASAEAEFARDVEQWGYSALWTPEAMGRDVLVNSTVTLFASRFSGHALYESGGRRPLLLAPVAQGIWDETAVALITQRSSVQIRPPQPPKSRSRLGYISGVSVP